MRKLFANLLNIGAKEVKPIQIKVRHRDSEEVLTCLPGDNLMDVTNRSVNKDVNVYGLCDKQLACTTCSVQV